MVEWKNAPKKNMWEWKNAPKKNVVEWGNAPKGQQAHSPMATPWVNDEKKPKTPCKGKSDTMKNEMFSPSTGLLPFQGGNCTNVNTQGVALGCVLLAFQAVE